jgi:hypothetical protein
MRRDLQEVLSYALAAEVPDGFVRHLVNHQHCWDDAFTQRLDELAYELRPDLAVWEITWEGGQLCERRLPIVASLL